MDAHSYNSLIHELCSLPIKKIDLTDTTKKPELVPESKPVPELKKNLNSKNYTIIEPLKLLTGPIKKTPLVMQGGKADLDFNQINTLVYNNPKHLTTIIKFYYDTYHSLINSEQLINTLVSIIYNEFTDPDLKNDLLSIITLDYIKSIPEMYKFNFHDKVMGDLLKECPNIKERLEILDQNILFLENKQKGGRSQKRIDTSYDKTVEEKIKNNINTLTTFLKSKSMSSQQKGGAITLIDMENDITAFNVLPALDKNKKEKIREMEEKSNMWVVELLEGQLANKIIKDDEHNIARYYLQVNPNTTDPKINDILKFVNDNASILTLKDTDRIKVNIPNKIENINRYGSSKPTYVTDKLKEYFNKKYEELLKVRSLNENQEEKPKTPLEQVQFILTQKGGVNNKNILEDNCFTSRQLSVFLKKVANYLSETGKKIDESDITTIQTDIDKLKEIEDNLIKNYKIFDNYIKIQEVFPDTSRKEITINHMKNVIDANQQLFDSYGNINTELLDVIDKVERYSNIKKDISSKELNELAQQTGGKFTSEKSYLKFNTQYDIEHFTARSFQKILDEMKKEE
jgi:hypothetical protein